MLGAVTAGAALSSLRVAAQWIYVGIGLTTRSFLDGARRKRALYLRDDLALGMVEEDCGAKLARTLLLILFTESLGVSFAVRIEEFLAASLPSCSEVGRCDVPIRPTFLGYGAEVLTELLQGRPTEKPVAIVDLINDKAGLEDNRMRDHRIVEGIGILGDIEILLHDTPRV